MPTLLATNALGTRVEIALDAPDTPALRAAGEDALAEIHHWHERLSRYLPHSLLSRINREASTRDIVLDDDTWELFALADRVHTLSGGAFDPTATPDGQRGGWASLVSLDHERRSIRFTRDGAMIDLGGIAKGFALDRAATVLREHTGCGALLHAGTSGVIVIGETPRAIGVRSATGVEAIRVANEALCVSAPRGRIDGGRSHIVDPRSADAAHGADTALVVGPSCAEADAWATALIVLGARPETTPARLRSALHDGRRWTTHDIHFSPASEAA